MLRLRFFVFISADHLTLTNIAPAQTDVQRDINEKGNCVTILLIISVLIFV